MPRRPSQRKPRRRVKPLPNCRAILICEKIIKDAFFGTISLIGVLTRLAVRRFPGKTSPFFLFVQLAHGIGSYELTIEIQDDQKGLVLARTNPLPLKFEHRTEVRDLLIPIPAIELQHAGGYTVAVFANGNEIGRQGFDTPDEEVRDAKDAS